MRELAEAAGVSAGTIKHYLREGLLPEPVKTSRNMAWYPREFVERVQLIKQLQEERFLPLKVIREVLEQGEDEGGPERLRALIELEDRVLERALSGQDSQAASAQREVRERYGLPEEALERLEKLEVLTPRHAQRLQALRARPTCRSSRRSSRMRASGYSEALGFTVYDTLIYKRHLERLVREEVEVMMERVAGEMDTERGRRAARARGRADARPGRRPAREAAGRGAAGAPRGAGSRERPHDRAADRGDHDELFALYALVVEEGGAFPTRASRRRGRLRRGMDGRQDRGVCRMRRRRARRLLLPRCRTSADAPATSATRGTWSHRTSGAAGIGRRLVEHSLAEAAGSASTP